MNKLDHIVFALVVGCTICGSALAGFMVSNRYERQQRENLETFEAACSKIERKVDELEDFMTKKVEKVLIFHEDNNIDLMSSR